MWDWKAPVAKKGLGLRSSVGSRITILVNEKGVLPFKVQCVTS